MVVGAAGAFEAGSIQAGGRTAAEARLAAEADHLEAAAAQEAGKPGPPSISHRFSERGWVGFLVAVATVGAASLRLCS